MGFLSSLKGIQQDREEDVNQAECVHAHPVEVLSDNMRGNTCLSVLRCVVKKDYPASVTIFTTNDKLHTKYMLLASNIGCSLIHLMTGVSVSTYGSLFAFILESEQKTPGAVRYTRTHAENGGKMKAGGSTDNLRVGIS